MKRISASEAKTLTKEVKNPNEILLIEKELDAIYSSILKSAEEGKSGIQLIIKPKLEKHKNSIAQHLKNDGYKVNIRISESYRDYDEYFVISWDT